MAISLSHSFVDGFNPIHIIQLLQAFYRRQQLGTLISSETIWVYRIFHSDTPAIFFIVADGHTHSSLSIVPTVVGTRAIDKDKLGVVARIFVGLSPIAAERFMGTTSGEEASARRALGDEVLQVVASERWAKGEFALFDIWISHSSKIEMLKTIN